MAALLGTAAVVLAAWTVRFSTAPATVPVLLVLTGLALRGARAHEQNGRSSPAMTQRYAEHLALALLGTGGVTIAYSVLAAATGILPRPHAALQAVGGLVLVILSRSYRGVAADLASGRAGG